jgi:hypothetical protein
MKQILLIIFLLSFTNVFSQTPAIIEVDFDNPNIYISIEIDSTNNNNIWQIGQPQKTVLSQALSQPNVIITDAINTYPINDTSSFYVSYYDWNCGLISGSYFCDTDSNDYGIIELSRDNGQTWIDLLTDSSVLALNWSLPVLTGNSNGWQYFDIRYENFFADINDTILLKFSFISDSIDTQHDGLMFDNLGFCFSVNTQNIYQLNNLKVFPNPTADILNFEFEKPIDNAEIRIYSSIGQLMTTKNITNTDIQFDVSDWNSGMYFYGVYVEGVLVKQGQVLVQR